MCTCVAKKRQEDKLSRYFHLPKQFVVDVDSLVKAARPGEITEIRITYDPNVPGTKTYLGVNLGNQVKRILKQYQLSAEGYDVMLICKDGYAPVRNATELLGTPEGYVVFKDRDALSGRNWTPEMERAFSPFYLVWKTDSVAASELPWPYGLVHIKLIERNRSLAGNISEGTGVMRGYHLFRRYCLSCHSINKTGGQVGPEMNWPRNITEYWTDQNIKNYIKDPGSFRYNAHMPAVKQVDDQGIDDIIRYLHYQKEHKCPE
jgi:cytochrome c2